MYNMTASTRLTYTDTLTLWTSIEQRVHCSIHPVSIQSEVRSDTQYTIRLVCLIKEQTLHVGRQLSLASQPTTSLASLFLPLTYVYSSAARSRFTELWPCTYSCPAEHSAGPAAAHLRDHWPGHYMVLSYCAIDLVRYLRCLCLSVHRGSLVVGRATFRAGHGIWCRWCGVQV